MQVSEENEGVRTNFSLNMVSVGDVTHEPLLWCPLKTPSTFVRRPIGLVLLTVLLTVSLCSWMHIPGSMSTGAWWTATCFRCGNSLHG